MNKKEYLEARQKMMEGQVDAQVLTFFYDYWITFRKDEYQDVPFDKFCDSFTQYLGIGFNYNTSIQKIAKYYDEYFSVQTVYDKKGGLLAIR